MTLRQRQSLFVKLLGKLINYAYAQGYELTLGDGYRPDEKGHMPGSLHYVKLAQDLNLFIGGKWIKSAHPAWDELGKFWKGLDAEAAWGGDFAHGDFNHFSIRYAGKA